MRFSSMQYSEPLFRPPSEAYSVIFQVTLGCSRNSCAFCEMYTSKKFQIRSFEEIKKDIKFMSEEFPDARKIFLADGNPSILSFNKLLKILQAIKGSFPRLQRISTYANPADLLSKSVDELRTLKENGLKLIYVGIESGDDELLGLISKGETFRTTTDGLLRAKEAGIRASVMILIGMGGKKYSEQHAVNSARVLNEIQPEFASTLVLSFPFGVDRYKERFGGEYVPMTQLDLLKELKTFIENTDLESTVFRSDHASNYLILKGGLSKDKKKFIEQIEYGIDNPQILRKEWMRGL